jgi:hypothetical protein
MNNLKGQSRKNLLYSRLSEKMNFPVTSLTMTRCSAQMKACKTYEKKGGGVRGFSTNESI